MHLSPCVGLLVGILATLPVYPAEGQSSDPEPVIQQLRQAGLPTTIDDLALPRVSDEANGRRYYAAASELRGKLARRYPEEWRHMPVTGTVPWEDAPASRQNRVIHLYLRDEDFARLFAQLHAAAQRPLRLATDQALLDVGMDINQVSAFRALHQWLACKAFLEARYGKPETAYDVLLDGMCILTATRHEPGIVHELVRQALLQLLLDTWTDTTTYEAPSQLQQQRLRVLCQDYAATHSTYHALQADAVSLIHSTRQHPADLQEHLPYLQWLAKTLHLFKLPYPAAQVQLANHPLDLPQSALHHQADDICRNLLQRETNLDTRLRDIADH